ncbi:MAG: cupin domain-containing protein [Lachnospiraceae bacterium]|nr:cupin domain-containing protein [Lachnospiraceae bacterium]
MSCNRSCNSSYVTNLVSAARQNYKNKSTVFHGDYLHVNVMCIPMYGEIGVEVHENEDQLITVVCGNATVKLGNTRCTADCVRKLCAGDSIFIPAGTWHNVCNCGNGRLKLISAYAHANTEGGCGCTQNAVVSGNTNTGCGCTQSINTDGCNVFNTTNYNWSNTQTQDNGCSCAIDSGC